MRFGRLGGRWLSGLLVARVERTFFASLGLVGGAVAPFTLSQTATFSGRLLDGLGIAVANGLLGIALFSFFDLVKFFLSFCRVFNFLEHGVLHMVIPTCRASNFFIRPVVFFVLRETAVEINFSTAVTTFCLHAKHINWWWW